jgi:tRNA modification GTPase
MTPKANDNYSISLRRNFKVMKDDSVICAIATPPGNGAIALIRLSGKDSIAILDPLFQSPNRQKSLSKQATHTVHFGSIVYQGNVIDEVVVTLYKEPHSYTGEEVVEISCHGSTYIQQFILQVLTKNGARLAKPGEFTLRAFMNGKMDLSQAEAVADLIASESSASHDMAMRQLRGGFYKQINTLRTELLNFSSLIELELDFGEEDVEFANRSELNRLVARIGETIEKLVKSFALGNVLKNGVPVAIVGSPNVGKSTLLNTLLQEEKAIVSEIAGTTRDAIEDVINIEGIRFRFIDTAGIRSTTDTIETMGIERTFAKVSEARIILLLVDATETPANIEKQIATLKPTADQHLIVVVNKIDIHDPQEIERKFEKNIFTSFPTLLLSAKHHINTGKLTALLLETIKVKDINQNDVVVSNARHYEALTKALEAVLRVENSLQTGVSSDFIAQDIREIMHHLGEITGEITTDEILGNIFSKFCIGK